MLYTTKTNRRTDAEYQKFIEICNEVLPLKIETPYINLANSIDEYLDNLRKININDNDALKSGLLSRKISVSLNNNLKAESNVSNRVKEIAQQESYSLEDYEELMKLAQRGKQLVSVINGQKIIIDDKQRTTIEKNVSSSEYQNELANNISNIANNLKLISELDLDDNNKRLDNLEITAKHVNQISNLSIGGKNKQNAYLLLIEFLKTRKNAFKMIEEFAYHILEKYKNRETDFSEDLFKKYILSSIALEACELGDGVFSKGNFIFNDFYSDELLTASKIYNAYMNGEDISPEVFREAHMKEKDYNCNVLINEVESAVKRQPNSAFNM